jgi:transposase
MVPDCDNCAKLKELEKRIDDLEAKIAALSKNSSNSHKPPSSDIVKPPKPPNPEGKKRDIGGQPGHERHERAPFAPEQVDRIENHDIKRCPVHGTPLDGKNTQTRTIQKVHLPEKLFFVTEHRIIGRWCDACGEYHFADTPAGLDGGLFDERMRALVTYMKGACHMSYSAMQLLLADVMGLSVTQGFLVKEISRSADSLEVPYNELLCMLPKEERLNVDETGHKENGEQFWTWVFRSPEYALFRIDQSRGSKVLLDTLGAGFKGLLGCDYFSAYRKFIDASDARVQFCLAHLVRDVKFLVEHPDKVTQNYGKRVLKHLRRLFRVFHRREEMSEENFIRALERAREKVITAAVHAPSRGEARNMAKRFHLYGREYFTFITTPTIAPTNNLAEQAIRFVVIDRKITQGTRGVRGRRWCERIWTVLATSTIQAKSAFKYLVNAITAHKSGMPAPSLVNSP